MQVDPLEPPYGWTLSEHFALHCTPPYRLDLTVSALRRIPSNPIDTLTTGGLYTRAFARPSGITVCRAAQQPNTSTLDVAFYQPSGQATVPQPELRDLVCTMLATEVDLSAFYAVAEKVPELASFVTRARGVKPPRYSSLWEALCNSVLFQQVSLESAMSTMRRLVAHLAEPVVFGDAVLYPFPTPESYLATDPDRLRSLGLSAAKVRTLHDVAVMLLDGQLTTEELAALPTSAAMSRLTLLRGIGPWTAAVVMLRGFGRLDVFPAGDSGMRRNLRGLLGDAAGPDIEGTGLQSALGPWRGMLYYHLLLWRLARRGLVNLPTRLPEV
ncbi:MAG: DNA-3-methyladenine glycosylase 2 family protein [Chloroflexota bacterium]